MRGREGGNVTGGVDQFSCRVMIVGTFADDAARVGGVYGKKLADGRGASGIDHLAFGCV